MKHIPAAAIALWLMAGTAAAQQEPPLGEGDSLIDFAYKACTEAPTSEVCRQADALLRQQIVQALLQLGEGSRAEGRDLVVSFADHRDPAIRLAAIAALGGLSPDAGDTPLLLARLNDPVPAVRQAALAALDSSSDSATIPIVDRSRDDQGGSLQPDPPPDPGLLGVSLPEGVAPLRFTEDAKDGVVAFVTDRSPQGILDYYAQLTGRPVLGLAELKAGLIPDWAKTPGMGFYQQLGERMEKLAELPQDEMMAAQLRMALLMGMIQQGVEPEELKRWRNAKLWGDLRAMVLAVDPMLEMPSQLLLVYRDNLLQRTGFAIQWLPAFSIPPGVLPATGAAPQPPVEEPIGGTAEAEALIWRTAALVDNARTYEAYLKVLPNGAHAAGARAALARLKSEASQEGQQQQQGGQQQQQQSEQQTGQTEESTTPPLPSERKTVTTPSGITLTTLSPIRQMQPVDIAFDGLDLQRNPWITIVPKGAPDTTWTDWTYTHAVQGTVKLPGQRPGDYEIRALLENPREVVARLEIGVVSTTSGPPSLAVVGEAKSGQPIEVKFANLPGDTSDWIAIAAVGKDDSQWNDWIYTGGKIDGEVTLRAQVAGAYELRAYADRPKREILTRVQIIVLP